MLTTVVIVVASLYENSRVVASFLVGAC